MKYIFFTCAVLSVVTTVGILYSLASQAWGFFQEIGVFDFLTGTNWSPDPQATVLRRTVRWCPARCWSRCWAPSSQCPWVLERPSTWPSTRPTRPVAYSSPSSRFWRAFPRLFTAYFALTFVTPLLQGFIGGSAHLERAQHRTGHGADDHSHRVVAERGRHGGSATLLARGGVRAGRHAHRGGAQSGGAGGALGHCGGVHPRAVAGHWRDDAGDHRGRRAAEPDLQPRRADPDHDRLHRPGEPGRSSARLGRVQHPLRGWVCCSSS